jgi:lipoprotein-releasing system ATP-binding protein
MTHAYNESYLNSAKDRLSSFFDYTINDCKMSPEWACSLFVNTGYAKQFEQGNPAYIAGMSKKEAVDKAMQLLDYLNLTERKDHKPSMLSGGEQQRIAVARALINDPAIILADEPSGNLDSQSAKELHQLFFDLRNKTGQTFVIVTHNPQLAEMADRTFTMKDGLIVL